MRASKRLFICFIIIHLLMIKPLCAGKPFSIEETGQKSKINQRIQQSKQLGFQENKGQMTDAEGKPTPYVLFKAQASGINIWITTSGLTYQFIKAEKKRESKNTLSENSDESIETKWNRVDMVLKGATINKENIIVEDELLQGKTNYYLGHCPNGIFDVKTYKKITIKNIYKGIDWVLYTKNGFEGSSIKQDFIVHPNANPDQIKLIYEGSGKIKIKNNQIHFQNEIGELKEGKLLCYQGCASNKVLSKYIVQKNEKITNLGAGNFTENQESRIKNQVGGNNLKLETQNSKLKTFSYEVSVQLSNYDKSKTLIIDPELVWGTFYGGAGGVDTPKSVETDAAGNVYVVGHTETGAFPVLNLGGAFNQGIYSGGFADAFILKFDNSGVLLWATFYGGNGAGGADEANDIAIDGTGNIFIAGYTTSTNLPTLPSSTPGAYYLPAKQGFSDAFILKFDNAGARQWATYFGGLGDDKAWSICCDPTGNIFFTGYTGTNNFPFIPLFGAYNDNSFGGGYGDVFLVKCDNVGNLLWSTYYGGSAGEQAYAIASNQAGDIYVVGRTASSANFPLQTSGAYYQGAYAGGGDDAFILKFNNLGVRQWATYYGGNALESANAVICDALGNVYVAGNVDSPNFPIQPLAGAYNQPALAGANDAFILKFDSADNLLWGTHYGGGGNELFYSYSNLKTDKCNNVYLTFDTESSDLPTQPPSCPTEYYDNSLSGFSDNVIIKFSNVGVNLWATYFGGDGNDFREAIALDNDNNLFMASEMGGVTSNASYPLLDPGNNAYYDPTYNPPSDDLFITKLKPPIPTYTLTHVDATSCDSCDGSATIILSCGDPNYSYFWSNGNQTNNNTSNTNTVSNLCPGTYTVTAVSNCSDTISAIVTIIGINPPTPVNVNVSMCVGTYYVLPGGDTTIFSGVYIDSLTRPNGCDSIIITTLNFVTVVNYTQTNTICIGDTLILPGGTIVTTAGVFSDTLLGTFGCDTILTATVNTLNPTSYTQNSIICQGNSFQLPDNSLVTSSGTFVDSTSFSAVNGCDSIITTILTVTPALTHAQNISICFGSDFILPGGTSVTTAGVYVNTLQTASNCDSIVTTTLIVNQLPIVASGPPLVLTCNAPTGFIFVTSTATGATYAWAGSSIVSGNTNDTAIVNGPGTYTVTVTDTATGCTNTATVIVTSTIIIPNLIPGSSLALLCNPDTVVISASSSTAGVIYNWSGPGIFSGGNTSAPTVNAAGTYTVTVLDVATGCTITATVTVTNATPPTAGVSPDITIVQETSTTLIATGGTSVSWNPTTNLSSGTSYVVNVNPLITTTYCVEVTDSTSGCRDTACVTVFVERPCPTGDDIMKVPNAFSPNEDNINDEFCLQGWDMCIDNFSIHIYDRWGKKVFLSGDPNFCWDGKYKGKTMDSQVFVYYIIATYKNISKKIEKNGNISLIR